MTNLLIASNIVLWIALIVITVIVFALVRQIGVLYERVAPAGALSINQQLKVGQTAPELDVINLKNQQTLHIPGLQQRRNVSCYSSFRLLVLCVNR